MRKFTSALLCCSLCTLCGALSCAAAANKTPTDPKAVTSEAASLLIDGALHDGVAYARLTELTDEVGPRLSGSPGAAVAVSWAEAKFKADGISVHLEPVLVPHWVRNHESGEIVSPALKTPRPLALTALGGSGGTPAGGVTAEVVEVRSLAELGALGEKVRGKIVLFQHDMAVAHDYGLTSGLRANGPVAAARLGAVAALIRSLATASFRSPHTGMMKADPKLPIPGAALSVEDAEQIHRLLANGPVTVHLDLGAETLADAPSFNVVAEVRGREKPEEIVLIGAHLDSWDLATGAIDDGAGVAMVMEALRVISKLPVAPRRTVRAVLFMNEENGIRGGLAYAKDYAADIQHHIAVLEADIGAGRPLGFTVHGGAGAVALLRPYLEPLDKLGSASVTEGDRGGADISPLAKVDSPPPVIELDQDTTHYFDVHHSAADTLDKVEPRALAESTAAVAWVTYSLAEMPETLPRPAKSAE
jgi:carboxypeptidase Q